MRVFVQISVVLIFGLFLILPLNWAQNCPQPSEFSNIYNVCIETRKEAVNYETAMRACVDNFGEIVSIHNAFENAAIAQLAKDYGINGRIFIGLQKLGNTWGWSASGEMDYTKWGGGEPRSGNCAVMDASDSSWHTVDCEQEFGRICLIQPKSLSFNENQRKEIHFLACFTDWVYFDYNDFCYYHGYNKTFNGAQRYCAQFDAYLVSIHSDLENDFVKNLTYSESCEPIHGYIQGTTILGGSFGSDNRTASWIDETLPDYTGIPCYHGGEPNTILMNSFPSSCGDCADGRWWINFESRNTEIYPDFVCKVMPFEGISRWKNQ